jgi:nicotinate-nucleotide adenylyltransferase
VSAGILGGTLDPPHVGHVALAEAAQRELGLDRVVVVVVGEAPHKRVDTPAETRFRLAAAAFAGVQGVELSRLELDRPGPSYTVDTARWAAEELGPDTFLIVGADEFADFLGWKDPDEILEHIRLAVAARPGFPAGRLEEVRDALRRPDRVTTFPFPEMDVSSREVRARVERGEPIADLVPPEVEALIRELGLYR